MSQALPKRLRLDDLPEEATSPEDATETYEEWKGKEKEKEKSVGYDDGPYWQFLLARAGVPVIGISEVADSELTCFSDDYP